MATEETAGSAILDQPRAVRGCDGCTLCCKVLAIEQIEKPAGKWCPHCRIGNGCGIYETRPLPCSAYVCGYLTNGDLGEEWKPATSRLILPSTIDEGTIVIHADPAKPDAWRRQPYFSTLQKWARERISERQRIVVNVAGRIIVILPDHAVDFGAMGSDEMIVITTSGEERAGDRRYEAYAVKTEVWEKAMLDPAVRTMVSPDTAEGFRAGRRVE